MCFDLGDCDSVSMVDVEERTARKPHKCDDCYLMIQKGDRYWTGAWRYEGSIWWAAVCQGCMRVRKVVERLERARGCGHESVMPYGRGIAEEYLMEIDPHMADYIRAEANRSVALVPVGGS